MHSLDVFTERAGVGITLGAAHDLAHVGFLVAVCAILMLGAVGGVTEGLVATWHFALIWLLPRVGAQVGLQILQP